MSSQQLRNILKRMQKQSQKDENEILYEEIIREFRRKPSWDFSSQKIRNVLKRMYKQYKKDEYEILFKKIIRENKTENVLGLYLMFDGMQKMTGKL